MQVSGNQFITNALRNLAIPIKSDADKKSDNITSERQQQLDELKRIVADEERYQKSMAAEQIAKRIARGEYVSDVEKEQVRGVNPDILIKAEEANSRRMQMTAQLKNATTPLQARAIILDGKLQASEFIEKGEELFGELLLEAIKKAEADYYGVEKTQSDSALTSKLKDSNEEQGSFIDVRL